LKTRVISGILAFLLLFFVVVILNKVFLGISIFLLSIIGLYEFYNSMSKAGYKPIKYIGYISSIFILPVIFNIFNEIELTKLIQYIALIIFLMIIFLFQSQSHRLLVLNCQSNY